VYVTIGRPYDGFARERARLQAEGQPLEEIAKAAAGYGVQLV